jgi:hypothetical protein
MIEAIYALCAAASALCAALLFRGFRGSRTSLLFWSSLCFVGLAINNILLLIHLVFLPATVDLSIPRTTVALASISLLVYGLIWEVK